MGGHFDGGSWEGHDLFEIVNWNHKLLNLNDFIILAHQKRSNWSMGVSGSRKRW